LYGAHIHLGNAGCTCLAWVAQLVECRPVNHMIWGSNPCHDIFSWGDSMNFPSLELIRGIFILFIFYSFIFFFFADVLVLKYLDTFKTFSFFTL
jgi:hypothetical protein